MSRIDAIFQDCRDRGRTALMPFITAGHPSLQATADLLPALEEAGASVIELGIPFSDPIADGPVIAGAMHEALQRGVSPRDVFETVRAVRNRVRAGLIAMVSHSIVARNGPESFVADAAAAGFDGLIIPDIDIDDARLLSDLARQHELAFAMLIAPTTGPERLRHLTQLSRGFVYLLARAGITGETDIAPDIAGRVAEVRACTDLPIAVGFGISRPEHVQAVTAAADAAIVGSALVRRIGEAEDPVADAAAFIRELATGLRAPA